NFEKKKDKIIFSVHDTGIGIPEKDCPKIFQKFFRASNVIKARSEGTGLGLFIAKSIIESSGGEIWFESVEDDGTTFNFSLPINAGTSHKAQGTRLGKREQAIA
ncbi:MAG TPA: ATP-binding protein, partial [Patescibacteria group bacterium]